MGTIDLADQKQMTAATLRELIAANYRVIIAIFIIALSVRLVYLSRLVKSPLFDSPTMDAAVHDDWAYQLAKQGQEPSQAPYFRAPLYAYFLSIFYRLGERGPGTYLLIRLVQFILGSLSCVLIYVLGRRFYGPRVAAIAGVIAALYWPYIYFEGELLIPALLLPLILGGFVIFSEAVGNGRIAWFAASGACFGLASITRPNILLFFPILVAWYLWPGRDKPFEWQRLRAMVVLSLVIACCIVPVTMRNFFVGKDVVLISSQAGVNFYIGNNQHSDGKTAILPGTRATWWGGYLDSIRMAEQALGRSLRPSEVSRFWFWRGVKFLFGNPLQAGKLYLKKVRYLLNNVEISNNKNIYFFRNYAGLINLPLFTGFGIILPLAISGLVFARRGRYWWLQTLFIAVYSFSIVLFFVNGRFRLPLTPFLILAAAAFIVDLVRHKRHLKALAVRLGLALALAIGLRLISLPLPPADVEGISDGHFMLANAYVRKGMLDAAYANYRKGISLREPYRSRSYLGLGKVELAKGKLSDAERNLSEAWRLNPLVRGDIVNLLVEENQLEFARRLFESGDSTDQMKAGYYLGFADRFLRQGEYTMAATYYQRVIELDKSSVGAFVNLGNIYDMVHNDPQRAITVYREGLRYHPDNEALKHNLADTLK